MTDSTPWYEGRTQQQKILLTAAVSKLSGTEWAVLTVLLQQPDYRVPYLAKLWDGRLLGRHIVSVGVNQALPYTRQGIDKAVRSLQARGWLELELGHYGQRQSNPPVQLLPAIILAAAPAYLRNGDVKAAKGAERSTRNKRSPRSRATPVAQRSKRNKRSTLPASLEIECYRRTVREKRSTGRKTWRARYPGTSEAALQAAIGGLRAEHGAALTAARLLVEKAVALGKLPGKPDDYAVRRAPAAMDTVRRKTFRATFKGGGDA